jgi:superfamily II DNA/RNA helicase
LEEEIETLKKLEKVASAVKKSGMDKKWEQLSNHLQKEGRDKNGNWRKMLIFSEHRDTVSYLVQRIRNLIGKEEAVVSIVGGMPREKRRNVQERFVVDPDVAILVATDAASEGVNLQRANLMVNYDLPWNPNRIEQRFGHVQPDRKGYS